MRLPHYCQRLPQQYHRLYHRYRSIPYLSYNYTKILLSDRLPRIEHVTPTCEDYAVVLLLPHRDDIAQFKFPASDIGLTFKSVFKRWTCLFNLDCFQLTGSQPRSFGQLSVKNMSTQVPWARLSPGPLTKVQYWSLDQGSVIQVPTQIIWSSVYGWGTLSLARVIWIFIPILEDHTKLSTHKSAC